MGLKDEDGLALNSGDHILFSFGIPPTCVLARLNTENGELWINCIFPNDIKPKRERLSKLMRWYQVWKATPRQIAARLPSYKPTGRAAP